MDLLCAQSWHLDSHIWTIFTSTSALQGKNGLSYHPHCTDREAEAQEAWPPPQRLIGAKCAPEPLQPGFNISLVT